MNFLSFFDTLTPARTRQLIFICLGIALVLSGIIIMATPLVTGMVLCLVGVYILLRNSLIARRLFVRLKRRYPGPFKPFDNWRRRRRR